MSKKVIEIKDVCKTYFMGGGMKQDVLKNVNMTVEEGEFVAIMGPSGAGKSTFMNVLGCLDRPTSGTYILGGKEVSAMNDNEQAYIRNHMIGFVFQGFNLLMRRTLTDNVSLPLIYANDTTKEERVKRAVEKLELVGLKGFTDRFPNQISGGMQQRVAIARALINNPEMILADEPTGNLDSKTSDEIMLFLQQLNREQGITIVLVTHEPDIAQYARRLVRIVDGQVAYDGDVNAYMEQQK
ncbi:MAG: ABC transporter ATP-binding protein [Alphaproteobacteria bacterium]|nr:ABC transporter ATP-binding protein [Alphaproteobacteria bacterium]